MASYDRSIPPGGVGKITLEVDTTGYQGKIRKNARVYTNDAQQPSVQIYLAINVRPHIIVEPASRIVLRGVAGEDVRQVLQLRRGDDHPLEITGAETNLKSLIDYRLRRKQGGQGYELQVMYKGTGSNTSRGFLRLFTNHPLKKEIRLPVFVNIRPEFVVWPTKVIFENGPGRGSKGGDLKKVLTIASNRDKVFRLKEFRYNKEYFQVRLLTSAERPRRKYRLEVVPLIDRLPEGKARLQDTLIITTDVAQAGELKVPMSIRLGR